MGYWNLLDFCCNILIECCCGGGDSGKNRKDKWKMSEQGDFTGNIEDGR